MKKYDIAAYVWPAYTGDEPRTRMFWPEGIGEWQTVKNQKQKQCGYFWNRKPVWGYVNEADPYVMSMQIDAAADHGVNVFIYDWYWYDHRPFLENCLNDGFLKAPNNKRMKFYLMWANHDVGQTWDIRTSSDVDATIWEGKVDRGQFEIIGKRWLEKYFTLDNYYKIDGKPVVSIYDLCNFVASFGGAKETKDAMQWLDREARKYDLPGVHFQFIRWSADTENLSGVDNNVMETGAELMELLGFASLTHYQFVHFANIDRDYAEIMEDVKQEWEEINSEYAIPYYPHVSIGWDNNPRFLEFRNGIVRNNPPEQFEKALRAAKEFADKTGVSLITINSWNEWTETSYLEPDSKYGYGYLQAVKKVFSD